jgi:2-polyprenyl-6-methoxyphenol hydroxylase-like FAD-dependent oxidoreductase
MRRTEIAIAGGGLAGSMAAAMLGRAGVDALLVDPHPVYPPDFRSEKLVDSQIRVLHKTGLAEAILQAATPEGEVWIARFGRVVEKRRHGQHNILYETLVNRARALIPRGTHFIHGKVVSIATGAERQEITLSNGEEISARLVILANGLNIGLRHKLGMRDDLISPCHSISIGFGLEPSGRADFDFRALTFYSEHPNDRTAYLTLFPIGSAMRANLFVYRDLHDPWVRKFRESPRETLLATFPSLRSLTGDVEVTDSVQVRPVDLRQTECYLRDGLVLLGDAFSTSCPAAGTGVDKVFTDVERLCNGHVPRWLTSPGMGKEKIAAFYEDPVKRACDAHSLRQAYHMRSLSIEDGFVWRARRWTRFLGQWSLNGLRTTRHRLTARASPRPRAAAIGGA